MKWLVDAPLNRLCCAYPSVSEEMPRGLSQDRFTHPSMKHISLIAAIYASFSCATGFCQGLSVVNPSFETPVEPSGSNTDIQLGAGSSSAVPGWTVVSAGAVFVINNDQNNPSNALINQNGSQYLVDVAVPESGYSGAGTVSQILSTSFATGWQEYDLFVWAGNWTGNTGSHPAQLGDYIFIANSAGTVLAATSLDAAPTDGSMAQFEVSYPTFPGSVGNTGPIEIGFTSAAQNSTSIMAIDDFAFYMAVPEPNSLVMAVFGSTLGCIMLAGARRKSTRTRCRTNSAALLL